MTRQTELTNRIDALRELTAQAEAAQRRAAQDLLPFIANDYRAKEADAKQQHLDARTHREDLIQQLQALYSPREWAHLTAGTRITNQTTEREAVLAANARKHARNAKLLDLVAAGHGDSMHKAIDASPEKRLPARFDPMHRDYLPLPAELQPDGIYPL